MMRTGFMSFIPAWLLSCALSLQASQITLDISPASSFRDGNVRVTAKLTNLGDEPARQVQVEAFLQDHSDRGRLENALEPGATDRVILDLGQAPEPPGVYTVTLQVHYQDARGYPFSALSSIPLITAVRFDQKKILSAQLSGTEIRDRGMMELHLSSKSETPERAEIRLVLPDALQCEDPVRQITLAPRGHTTVQFPIRNHWATQDSSYAVLAVIRYLQEGQHQSTTVHATVRIGPPGPAWLRNRTGWMILMGVCITLFLLVQIPGIRALLNIPGIRKSVHILRKIFPAAVLLVVLAFTLFHIPPRLLLLDTLTVGGDTPAHSYLAGHLKTQLFEHGRIVSWADGWWCGFPMFQFYFPLPYLLMAGLSLLIPLSIAFKVVSVLGILALPACAWGAARILRLRKPIPVLLAIAMIPCLFVRTHTMWGVNIYSTFAGMIANSISFPLMLLFVACAYDDCDRGTFRFRTVFLLVGLMSSHFFTSVMAGLMTTGILLLHTRGKFLQALSVLVREWSLALALMAWWIIPLVAQRAYSVDFGENWPIRLHGTIPPYALWLLPFAVIPLLAAIFRKEDRGGVLALFMLGSSVFLFFFGYRYISPVFVNVRLWPFIFFSILMLEAAGIGLLLARTRGPELAVCGILMTSMLFGIGQPNHVLSWAEWNYKGLQKKPLWPVFEELVLPLDGTPGRLANDLHEENPALGSSRIFECVPHLIRKPVLEGGLVNSAVGSLFSYYVQGETSQRSAGFPSLVKPAQFNFTNATRHLELFNVKHFIARWPELQQALARSKDWRRLGESHGWELYELLTHNGQYVIIPDFQPAAVRLPAKPVGRHWKEAGLEWLYTAEAMQQPFVLLEEREKPADDIHPILDESSFHACLSTYKNGGIPAELSARPVPPQDAVTEEFVRDGTIRFRTRAVGMPHIIKCTYHPNWKVTGAKQIYKVTPGFMLVYPEQELVTLEYGLSSADYIGGVFFLLALTVLAAGGIRQAKMRMAKKQQTS